MSEVNLSGLDLNLLPPLEAVLRRRNVTLAARDVGISQPAMSRALLRLRAVFNDPLLVRASGGFVLTSRGQSLQLAVTAALNDVKQVFEVSGFDPSTLRRTIRMAASDSQTILLTPPLMALLAKEAPAIDLKVEGYSPDLPRRMAEGSIDLTFAKDSTPLPPGAMSEIIADDHLVLVMRRGHPKANINWCLTDYATVDHASIAFLGDGQSDMDSILAKAGVTRRIALTTPHFMAAIATIAATDLVSTLSYAFAKRFEASFDLVLIPPPFADTRIGLVSVWSHIRHTDPLLLWFRRLVKDVAAEVYCQNDHSR